MPLRKEFEHLGKLFEKGGASQGKIWIVEETTARTFEEPAAGDMVTGISFEGAMQSPIKLESEVRDFTQRKLSDSIAGPIDHVERTLKMEARLPGQLTGTDDFMGSTVLEAAGGDSSRIDAGSATPQVERAIVAVTSHADAGTVLEIAGAEADFDLGSVWALRSYDSRTLHANHQPSVVAAVAANGGNWDVTFFPPFFVEPVAGTDKVEPGITINPQTAFDKTYSVVTSQGYAGEQFYGGVIAKLSMTIARRGILSMEAVYQAIGSLYSQFGYVHGESSVDSFLTTDTVLDVPTTGYAVGALVNLEKWDVATGLLSATETKAAVTAVDHTLNTITLSRGGTPISVTGGAQDLQAETTAVEEKDMSAGYVEDGSGFVRLEIDDLGILDVPLGADAAYDADNAVVDIHAALKYAQEYGRLIAVPWGGSGIDYSSGVASKVADKLHLVSKAFGSQSRIRAILTGLTGDRFTNFWTPVASWEVTAEYEVQIHPWNPGGTETRDPAPEWEGYGSINGKKFRHKSVAAVLDNDVSWQEDVRNGTQYAEAHAEGYRRKSEMACTALAYGCYNELRDLAFRDVAFPISVWGGAGVGETISFHILRGKTTAPTKSGDAAVDVAFTVTATDPELDGWDDSIAELIIGIT